MQDVIFIKIVSSGLLNGDVAAQTIRKILALGR
jgi:hypothetical protein